MRYAVYLPIGAALVLLSGLLQGFATDRWGRDHSRFDEVVARLADLPYKLGDWEGRDAETEQEQFVKAGCAGWLTRHYVRHRDQAEVSIMILGGKPGPISVHPPEACYQSRGFSQHRSSQRIAISRPPAEFWLGSFTPEDPDTQPPLRILWGWCAHGQWSAPDHPRIVFASEHLLFKLYLLHPVHSVDSPLRDDPSLDLLTELLPAFRRTVFPDGVE